MHNSERKNVSGTLSDVKMESICIASRCKVGGSAPLRQSKKAGTQAGIYLRVRYVTLEIVDRS